MSVCLWMLHFILFRFFFILHTCATHTEHCPSANVLYFFRMYFVWNSNGKYILWYLLSLYFCYCLFWILLCARIHAHLHISICFATIFVNAMDHKRTNEYGLNAKNIYKMDRNLLQLNICRRHTKRNYGVFFCCEHSKYIWTQVYTLCTDKILYWRKFTLRFVVFYCGKMRFTFFGEKFLSVFFCSTLILLRRFYFSNI